jgi:hypothetical protein
VLDAITETRADGVAMMREMISEAHRIIDPHSTATSPKNSRARASPMFKITTTTKC